MTERIIPKSTVTTSDSGAHNAVDLDIFVCTLAGIMFESTFFESHVNLKQGVFKCAVKLDYIQYF